MCLKTWHCLQMIHRPLYHKKVLKELMSSAKNCLERLNEWFIENKLSLSIEKSNYVIYHTSRRKITNAFNNIIIQNSTIKRVTEVEYLRLVIDEHMNWRSHVNKICAKLAKYFSVFYNIRKQIPQKLCHTLYYAFIYSRIQYGIKVYGTACKTILNQLQVTQNKLLKVLFSKNYRYHTDELYQELKKLKIEDICNIAILKFVHRLRSSEFPISLKKYYKTREATHGRNTRNMTDLAKNKIKTNYGKRTVHYIGAKIASSKRKLGCASAMHLF